MTAGTLAADAAGAPAWGLYGFVRTGVGSWRLASPAPMRPVGFVLALLLATGCAVPEQATAPPPSVPHPARHHALTPVPDPVPDPLGRIVVPVMQVVAGRADTLSVADWFGSDVALTFGAHPDVRATALADGRFAVRARDGFEGLALVPFAVGGVEGDVLAVQATVEPTVTFTFTPDPSVPSEAPLEVFVIGAFNDWSRTADQLAYQPDGTLALTRAIPPGRYEYKLTVDGAEVLDPTSRDSVANPFGAYNNVLTVAPVTTGRLRLGVAPQGADSSIVTFTIARDDAVPFEFAEPDDLEEAGAAGVVPVVLAGNRPVPVEAVDPFGDTLAVDLDGLPAGSQRLRVAAQQGSVVSNWIEVPVHDRRLRTPAAPFAWTDAVIYQVVLDRFRNGDPTNDAPVVADSLDARANYHGGDLQGLLDVIESGYFTDLGVNALWLSPVYDNPNRAYRESPAPHRLYTGYHGYWPVQPRAVDEHLGDLALLRRVVDAAHAQGVRVLLDFVANHVHEDHPYAREHPDWFGTLALPDGSLNLRRWDDHRLTTWFEPYLPSFDYLAAPAAVDAVTADAVWWLRETGADGFRHDAVKHVPNAFWRALTARLRAELPERFAGDAPGVYQIGETFGSHALVSSYVRPGELDAQFNYNLYDATIATLTRGGSLASLAAEVARGLEVYGPLHTMGSVVSSHDKTRFLALAEGDIAPGEDDKEPGWGPTPPRVDDPASYRRMEMALAIALTTPGVPIVYYGDEVGMTGANDPDNRRPMVWDGLAPEQVALRQSVAGLIALRRDVPALREGTLETLRASDTLWVFRRATPTSEAVVAVNTGAAPVRVTEGGMDETVPAGSYRVTRVR